MIKILFAAAAYLAGSIPTGYLLVRSADRKDIRSVGSGSTGATNVLRVKGWKFALPVMAGDVLKGFLPAFLALRIFDDYRLAAAAGFLAVLGHCFPFAIGFRGGKGVATSMGAFAALAFLPFVAGLAVFVAVVALTRFVSLGSILAVLSFPFLLLAFHGPRQAFVWALAVSGIVVLKHGGNIRRLLRGRERKLGEKAA